MMAACSEERPLQADIHSCDGTVVKTFVEVLKHYLFGWSLILHIKISCLRHKLIEKYGGNVIVCKRDRQDIFFGANRNSSYIWCSLFSCSPLSHKLQLIFLIVWPMFLLYPKAELSIAAPEDESLWKGTDGSDGYFIPIGLIKSILVFLFYLI